MEKVILTCLISFYIGAQASTSLFHIEQKKYSAIPVDGVEGKSCQLPCNMTAAPKDSVYLVLWFKEGLSTPIYSYDVRELLGGEPKHWWDADLLGSRAFFNAYTNPTHLLLRHVASDDAGIYKCRVDFQREPTRNYRVNLTVIVPPKSVFVFDGKGQRIFDVIGPVNEGIDLELSCIAKNGSPPPQLVWLINGEVLDDVEEESDTDLVTNELTLFRLDRSKIDSELTCQAKYHPNYSPIQVSVTLDMYLAPVDVNIDSPEEPLSAGRSYEFICTTSGSKPTAKISWSIGAKKVSSLQEQTINNSSITRSVLKLDATSALNGQLLTCKAYNSFMASNVLQQEILLDIYFPPRVKISSGNIANQSMLLEGDSIYLNCLTEANPPPYKVIWKRNEEIMTDGNFGHAVFSNWSLMLQNIGANQEGNYSCVASNVEGDGHSSYFIIRVKHRPICQHIKPRIIGASIGDSIRIPCSVKAFPKPLHFEWLFDSSMKASSTGKHQSNIKRIHQPKARRNHGHDDQNKELNFVLKTNEDFGTVLCYAKNEFGRQEKPCIHKIVPAALPSPPNNCSVRDVTSSAISVKCFPDLSNISATFILEVFSFNPRKLLYSLTSSTPRFRVRGLDADTLFGLEVFSRNSDGNSNVIKLRVRTLKPPVKQLETRLGTEGRSDKSSSSSLVAMETASILGALIGGTLVFVIIIAVAIFIVKKKNRRGELNRVTSSKKSTLDDSPSLEEPTTLRGTDISVQDPRSKDNSEFLQIDHKYAQLHQQEEMPLNKVTSILNTTVRESEKRSLLKKQKSDSDFDGGPAEEKHRVTFEDLPDQNEFKTRSSSPQFEEILCDQPSLSMEDSRYSKPLIRNFKEDEKWSQCFSSDAIVCSQTLPSRHSRMKMKRGVKADDFETRPPDLVSCSSSPPSPAPEGFSPKLSYRSESLLLGDISVAGPSKTSFSLLAKRESIV